MKFKATDRTYKTGDKKGQIIKIPDIKCKEDIPPAVTYYFDSCMDFLKEYAGEENILLAQIHYDEDTPHLQAYFLPIVKQKKKKCFKKDKDGNIVKEEVKNNKGKIVIRAKLLRDTNGKMVYETVKGNFLNNDQFWKEKGGKNSFSKLQDSFNKFITDRGFRLDRGEIGVKKEHSTKLEYQINELKAEIKELKEEKDYSLNEIKEAKNTLEKAKKSQDKDILNPKKTVVGYNSKDVVKIIDYSKDLEQLNIIQENEIKSKDTIIKRLETENNSFKNNNELKKRNKIIEEQKETILEQKNEISHLNNIVNVLTNQVSNLKDKLESEINKFKKIINKLCNALDKVLGREPKEYIEDYERLADAINYDYYNYNKKNDKNKDDYDLSI